MVQTTTFGEGDDPAALFHCGLDGASDMRLALVRS